MDDIKEAGRYGLKLFPLAILTMVGIFLTGYGTRLFSGTIMSALQGTAVYEPVLIIGVVLFQLAGGALIFAGAFGALYRTISDAQENQPEN